MFYINSIKQNNNYGNPMGQYFKDSIQLPDELLNEYLKTKGFCDFEIQDNMRKRSTPQWLINKCTSI